MLFTFQLAGSAVIAFGLWFRFGGTTKDFSSEDKSPEYFYMGERLQLSWALAGAAGLRAGACTQASVGGGQRERGGKPEPCVPTWPWEGAVQSRQRGEGPATPTQPTPHMVYPSASKTKEDQEALGCCTSFSLLKKRRAACHHSSFPKTWKTLSAP